MAGCVLPLLVSVVLVAAASNSRVMFRGKWTQMIERLFFFFLVSSQRESEASAGRPFVK